MVAGIYHLHDSGFSLITKEDGKKRRDWAGVKKLDIKFKQKKNICVWYF